MNSTQKTELYAVPIRGIPGGKERFVQVTVVELFKYCRLFNIGDCTARNDFLNGCTLGEDCVGLGAYLLWDDISEEIQNRKE